MRTMDNQILQSGSEAVGQLVEWLSNPIAAEGAALYVGIAVVLGVGGTRLWDWYSEDDDEEVAFSDLLDEETLKDGKAERQLLDDIAESHKTITAPAAIEWDTRAARVGEQWTTTLYITEYPDYPNDGYLSDLFELTDIQFDLTAHLTPKIRSGRGTNCKRSLMISRWMLISNRAFGVPTCKSAPTKPPRPTKPSRTARVSSIKGCT